jgi:hypothetical protein
LVRYWGIVIYEVLNLALMFILATVFLDILDQKDSNVIDLKDVFTHGWYLRLASSIGMCVALLALSSNIYDFSAYRRGMRRRYADCDGLDMKYQIKRNKVLKD